MNSYNLTKKQQTLMLLPLLMGGFIGLLNETLLNVAFPQLMESLNVSLSTVQWLATSYMLVIGISVPVVAFLLETFTTKKLYLFAMLLLLVGSVFCGLSVNFTMLLIFRVVQGLGAGMLIPIMLNTVIAIFPKERRGAVIGLSVMVIIIAPTVGPTLCGLILQYLNWHWLFFSILPIIIVAMIIAWRTLINVSGLTKPKIDILSILLSTIGFGGLIFGISTIGSLGIGHWLVILTLVCGVLGLVFFVIRQLHLETPMLEMRVFRYPMFSLETVLLLISFLMPFSVNIILPTYFQSALGFTPLQAGLAVLPGGVISGIIMPLSGRLYDKIGAKRLVAGGFLIITVAMFFLSRLTVSATITTIILLHVCTFTGISFVNTPTQTDMLNQLPRKYNPHGVAITNTVQQVAAAFGSSLFIGLMGTVQAKKLANIVNPDMSQQHSALVSGVNASFTAALVLVAAAFVLSLFIRRKKADPQIEDDKTL